MLSFLGRRLISSMVMIFLATTCIFLIIHLLPGDPVVLALGEFGAANPEAVAKLKKQLKLDLPVPVQYYEWLKGVLQLDLGNSIQNDIPVTEELIRRIPRSLELIFCSLFISTLFGIPLGVLSAKHPNSLVGWFSSMLSVLGFSSPIFVTGLVFIIVFSLKIGWFPSSGYISISENIISHILYAVLPSFTLAFGFTGVVVRMSRASFSDVLGKDYLRTARAKGLSERIVTYRHGLLNALVPVIAVLGVRAGNLLGGMVIIESLFNWPGISSLLVKSCLDRDYPMIQGALLSIFLVFIVISLIVDLCHGVLDPRIREN